MDTLSAGIFVSRDRGVAYRRRGRYGSGYGAHVARCGYWRYFIFHFQARKIIRKVYVTETSCTVVDPRHKSSCRSYTRFLTLESPGFTDSGNKKAGWYRRGTTNHSPNLRLFFHVLGKNMHS